jgi:hypothetical protein
VCELLTFLCYCEPPNGRNEVIKGFELLRQHRKDLSTFDGWLKDLENTLDGRGKMGSLVGANDEFRRLGVFNAPDSHLMEYAVRILLLLFNLPRISIMDLYTDEPQIYNSSPI